MTNSKVQFQPPEAKGYVFFIFQLILVSWQNTKLHETLDIKKQWPLKFWIISISCTASTFKELFFSNQIFVNLSLNHTRCTSTIRETAYEVYITGCSLCAKEPIPLLSHCHLVPYHEPCRPFWKRKRDYFEMLSNTDSEEVSLTSFLNLCLT